MNEQQREHLERLISLSMDDRLSPEAQADLEQSLAASKEARDLQASLLDMRTALLAEAAPRVPAGLRERTIQRVAAVRARVNREAAILPMVRRLLVAAAILLCVGLFALGGGAEGFVDNGVQAGHQDPLKQPTIEDRIRVGDGDRWSPQPSLQPLLHWHFLRSQP